MNIKVWTATLKLTHEWTIATGVKTGGKSAYEVFLVELTDNGTSGIGESSPPSRYCESGESVRAFLNQIDANKLSFDDIPTSMAYLESLNPHKDNSAKCAINIALVDGAAKKAGKAIYDYFGIGFTEKKHTTSFSIGIDTPEKIRMKVLEAAAYPFLKLKVGGPDDLQNMKALREAAPNKKVRVDGNEGWKTKEEALKNIEWFAQDKNVEYVEQPMPSTTPVKDLVWLKERSPLPLYGDESFHNSKDVAHCVECFHGVNMKLCKTGGLTEGFAALQAARKAGLKTMIGCMIESSVLITAAAHLAELADHLDIDGNILINNDPFMGATAENGLVSFAKAPTATGLRVTTRK